MRFHFWRAALRLDRLLAVFPRLGEIPGLGVAGRQRTDDVGLLPSRLLAGLLRQLDRPLAVPDCLVRRCGQEPRQVVENARVIWFELQRLLEVDPCRLVVTDRNLRIAAAAPAREVLVVEFDRS